MNPNEEQKKATEELYDHIVSSHCTNDECHTTSHFYEAWKNGTRYLVHKRFGLNELEDYTASREQAAAENAVRAILERVEWIYEHAPYASNLLEAARTAAAPFLKGK